MLPISHMHVRTHIHTPLQLSPLAPSGLSKTSNPLFPTPYPPPPIPHPLTPASTPYSTPFKQTDIFLFAVSPLLTISSQHINLLTSPSLKE